LKVKRKNQKQRIAEMKGHFVAKAYEAWVSIKRRTKNPKGKNSCYKNITVCDRWKDSFANFIEDMGIPTTMQHSIDRIDSEKGYSPENCRWATIEMQSRNRSNSKMTEEAVNDIRTSFKSGNFCKKTLAKKYNITTNYVAMLVKETIAWKPKTMNNEDI
jgi:hypothetical protein